MNLKKLIESIENKKINYAYFILLFFGILFLRNFIEGFLECNHKLMAAEYFFIHYPLFNLSIFLTINLIVYFLVKEKIQKIAKIMVLVWFIILIVPIYDFIASNGIGYHIGYWIPGNENILLNFDFIGKTGMIGPTIGQKFMALISSILVGAYAWLKTQNHARGITAGIAVYAISIIYSIIPALISITLKIQLTEMINLLSIFWIALILLQGIIWLKIWKNKDF